MSRFTDAELRAEWAREAVLTSLGGLHLSGYRTAVWARFMLTCGVHETG